MKLPGKAPHQHHLRRILAVFATILLALPLAGCPDSAGPDGPAIDWAWTCGPEGQYGRIVIDYHYTATGGWATYHAGFRALGSGDVSIEVASVERSVSASEQFTVEEGQDYHLMIDFDGFAYDPTDPANIGRDDTIVLTSPAADNAHEQGVSFTEITEFMSLEIEACP